MKSPKSLIFRLLFAVVLAAPVAPGMSAQIVGNPQMRDVFDADSIRRDFKNQPFFGIYKDNYFTVGVPVNTRPNAANSNVKFQISIAQRVTNATLPWGTYLYIFYTQKCFWNVFENSMPMTDLNFNPGIGLTKPLFSKRRFIGKLTLMLEHESNGRDSIQSRSWNKVSLGANIIIDRNMSVHGKVWIPIIDGQNNRDILDYCGIYQMGVQLLSNNRRFVSSVNLVKRRGWNFKYNVLVDFGWRISKKSNEFIFLQYYRGYGEGLLEYNRFHNMVRVGLLIKPKMFSDF